MPYTAQWTPETLSRSDLDALLGVTVLEFGTEWCPHCQAVQQTLRSALDGREDIRHLKVEDGKGRPLGRSFGVKLWPNFVVLKDGEVVEQLARPQTEALKSVLQKLG